MLQHCLHIHGCHLHVILLVVVRAYSSNQIMICCATCRLAGELPMLYGAFIGRGDLSLRTAAVRLFSSLPVILPNAHPQEFVKHELWEAAPAGWDVLNESPTMFRGRPCMVPAPVRNVCLPVCDFLKMPSGGRAAVTEMYITPYARVLRASSDAVTVEVECTEPDTARTLSVPLTTFQVTSCIYACY